MKRNEIIRLVLGLVALTIVVLGAVRVLLPFATPILWALVLGTATWPAYRRLHDWLGGRTNLAALLMTIALTLTVLMPFVAMGFALAGEVGPTVERVRTWMEAEGTGLPESLKRIPMLEEALLKLKETAATAEGRRELVMQGAGLGPAGHLLTLGKNLLHTLLNAVITVFTLFFVYRDGRSLEREANSLLDRIDVGRGAQILGSVRETVRAVFFGWILTAAAQGVVAMLGYWIAGLSAPVLLGIATGLAAVIPFGVSMVWIPAVISLASEGNWGWAIFLTIWALAVVGLIDNVLRPLFISGPAKIPFILVFFGVLGGLATFGLLGLVLGPVFLAILLALLRQGREAMAVAAQRGPSVPSKGDEAAG
ncbi:MAG: AI-2E family transporter [Acidobacteriota bacterium]